MKRVSQGALKPVVMSLLAVAVANAWAEDRSAGESSPEEGVMAVLPVGEPTMETPGEATALDEVSVTATRDLRPTKDVPEAIAVVGRERIEDERMFNVKDALTGIPSVLIDSKNGGYDARLIIRGAGLKAPYGIREIMVLRDGVPMTDPDSFTRLDFIDTEDIERIEVSKGPGNIFSTGSAGGAIQIISKSVFAENANVAKFGAGNYGAGNVHVRWGGMVGQDQALALTFSRRQQNNDWRDWNRFDTTQFSVKHGLMLSNGGVLESELAYTEANLQLPGSMSAAQFADFTRTGEQKATQDAFKNSGRYSQIWFFNSKYEQEVGNWTFKPRIYANFWRHRHPVTGMINDSHDWVQNIGTDLEANYSHSLAGAQGTAVMGVTLRRSGTDDSRKYQYADVVTNSRGRIVATRSDALGKLAEVQKNWNTLYGFFFQESLSIGERWLVDVGLRRDHSRFEINTNEMTQYNYALGMYTRGDGYSETRQSFDLSSLKVGASYRLSNEVNLYGVVAQSDQVPSDSEIVNNPDINAPQARNIEVGAKGRSGRWGFDTALYHTDTTDEIVSFRQNNQTVYANAGKTRKKGFEFSGTYHLDKFWELGASYAYSDYRFVQYVDSNGRDLSGKQLPYVPRNQYALFALYKHPAGFKARIQANGWGQYYTDDANTDTYSGYEMVTNVMLGYEKGRHSIQLNIDNLFDKHYAMEVKKDTNGSVYYYAASPRQVMLTYAYKF